MTSTEFVLTEQIITTWGSEGRNKLLALAKTHWKGTNKEKGTSSQFRSILYFLCQQIPNGKLKQDDVINFLLTLYKQKDIGIDRELLQSCLADILCVLDAEVTCVSKDSKPKKEMFCRLVKELIDRKLMSETLLKERFDFDTLEQLGVVVSSKAFTQKYVRSKTRLFYKQQKFNLFREENEGYAKLIVELEFSTRVTRDPDLLLSHVQALIGQFSLDPNRVMDVILEVAEFYPQNFDFLVDLIRIYPSGEDTLSQLLTFKLLAIKNSFDNEPPSKFFQLLALLIQSDVLPLNMLYNNLVPSDAQVMEAIQKILSDAKKDSRATVTVQLENTPDKKELSDLLLPDNSIVSSNYMLSNQKICLLHAMLQIGDWEHANQLFQKLPEHYPVLFPSVRELLVSLIEFSVEPLYRKYALRLVRGRELEHQQNVFRYTNIRDLQSCNSLFEMCSEVGPYMTLHPIVLIKLIRIGRGFLKEYYSLHSSEQNEFERCFQNFISLIDTVILPSISLSGANCGLMEELWNMIKLYPYEISDFYSKKLI
ncbi:THO complex 2 (predicted), isoform CRA_b [Oopsacas minuta]|uniref:THO complex 2 (Predicted), isoform CRA_b n=1 Tax=Oopsacas minuta TaxID=111878 RepID=A0AAV7JJ79_9METZ|nr:THO complex 2 (predicted), isoform CRA_b [Oopsacas minuta]